LWEFFAAFVVNVIATALKFGDARRSARSTSPRASSRCCSSRPAALVWFFAPPGPLDVGTTVSIVSLSAGAALANMVSVVILIAETISLRR